MSAVLSDDRVALDVPAPAASDVAAIDGLGIDGLGPATEIGRGGLGVVYRARQSNLGREVAVKVLHGTRPDADGRERFRREAIATGRVSGHPHIVTVHSAGFTAAGDPFIVMEYVPDGSLGDTLRTRGPLTWQRASAAMVRIAGALASAHAARVLHRDVKPQNILVGPYGEQLADFGRARIDGEEATRSGAGAVTIAHTAPEILLGESPTVAADIYSLASTGFALLTGHAPFVRGPDDAVGTVVARIVNDAPPALPPEVPRELAGAIESALAKEPQRRPRTARDFGEALRDAQRAAGLVPTDMETGVPAARGDLPFTAATRSRTPFRARALTPLVAAAALGIAFAGGMVLGRHTASPSGPSPASDRLVQPRGITLDQTGAVLVVDRDQVYRVAAGGKIEVVAGDARHGTSGDGGLATQAELDHPVATAVDHAGNIYIADSSSNRVRVVRTDGTIHTFAGDGQPGGAGDGGPATAAELHDPEGLAVDADGNVFIVDTANRRVREVLAKSGLITTVVGSADPNAAGPSGTPALSYGLSNPTGIAFDARGRLIIADESAVLRLDEDGRIRAIAGIPDTIGYRGDNGPGTEALLSGQTAVAVDAAGDVLIVDTDNHRIRRLTPAGIITTIAGDGQQGEAPLDDAVIAATSAEFDGPQGIAVDAQGDIYVADSGNHRLCRITPDGRIRTVLR